jgi:hypothetical protein
MRKLILTLFLASASLVSFAQSTVKTIRMATPASAFAGNIPQGTQVVVLSTNLVYTATTGFASGAHTDVAAAITANALITVTDTTVSTTVVEEELTASTATYSKVLTAAVFGQPLGNGVLGTPEIVKVFVNGTLLPSGSYTVTIASTVNTLAITAPLYAYDTVQIIYDPQN